MLLYVKVVLVALQVAVQSRATVVRGLDGCCDGDGYVHTGRHARRGAASAMPRSSKRRSSIRRSSSSSGTVEYGSQASQPAACCCQEAHLARLKRHLPVLFRHNGDVWRCITRTGKRQASTLQVVFCTACKTWFSKHRRPPRCWAPRPAWWQHQYPPMRARPSQMTALASLSALVNGDSSALCSTFQDSACTQQQERGRRAGGRDHKRPSRVLPLHGGAAACSSWAPTALIATGPRLSQEASGRGDRTSEL
jgi:hypothetical protein